MTDHYFPNLINMFLVRLFILSMKKLIIKYYDVILMLKSRHRVKPMVYWYYECGYFNIIIMNVYQFDIAAVKLISTTRTQY